MVVLPDMVLDPWYKRWEGFDDRNGLCPDAAKEVRPPPQRSGPPVALECGDCARRRAQFPTLAPPSKPPA